MAKIAEILAHSSGKPLFICDFSPPKGSSYDDMALQSASSLSADFLSVPYNPGKSVYASSPLAAHSLRNHTGKEVSFTLATRDMNMLALQSLILGSSMIGLQNVIVVGGDRFTSDERRNSKAVNDSTPTALIHSIANMNDGRDSAGRALDPPTDFCIGAAADPNRSLEAEVALTHRKIEAGAHFLITQPGFTSYEPLAFLQAYRKAFRAPPSVPIFFGIQMISPGGKSFSPVPKSVREDLGNGIDSASIAIRTISALLQVGITNFYLVPPIYPGGARDYRSAQKVLRHIAGP